MAKTSRVCGHKKGQNQLNSQVHSHRKWAKLTCNPKKKAKNSKKIHMGKNSKVSNHKKWPKLKGPHVVTENNQKLKGPLSQKTTKPNRFINSVIF